MLGEAIREVGRTEVSTVPTKETPLPIAEILPGRSFMSRVADVLLRGANGLLVPVVVVIWLDIGEGLGKRTEWVARRLNRNYARYMEELEKYYSSPNDHVSGV